MRPNTRIRLRSAALVGATVALGISWSFALLHVRTPAYPLLWALAMPLLALYYLSGHWRAAWKHLPAAALSIYALVLWRSASGYGLFGAVSVGLGVAASLAVFAFASRLNPPQRPAAVQAPPATRPSAPRRRQRRARRQTT